VVIYSSCEPRLGDVDYFRMRLGELIEEVKIVFSPCPVKDFQMAKAHVTKSAK
jgi:hypothetical protein